ncbi:MAG TPA: SDR family NAD(P)-dependent oxidoreductase [Methylomirabilota bacterium]|nr:SDR family NAD(P)-dependent oxidoreductase [Methylomirabilota bacterium]
MNQIDLKGKKAIITGGSGGIGSAIAERFLASGAECLLWDINPDSLSQAARTLASRGTVHTAVVDITDPQAVDRALSDAESKMGGCDVLVNNAGIAGVTKKLWEFTPAEWSVVQQVNQFAVFLCCRAVVPGMIRRDYGRIVNIASIAGKEGNPNASHYSASKAAVIALTKSLAKELANTNIRVNCITPAVIQTDILKQVTREHIDYMLSKIPLGRFGRTDEVAALAAWLASEDCSFSTGAVFDISGGRATY